MVRPHFILYGAILTDQNSGGLADSKMLEIRNTNPGPKWVWISSRSFPKCNVPPKFPYENKVRNYKIRASFFMNARIPRADTFGRGPQPLFFFQGFKFELVSGFCLLELFHGQLINILLCFSFYDYKLNGLLDILLFLLRKFCNFFVYSL